MSPLPGAFALFGPLQYGGARADLVTAVFRELGRDIVAALPTVLTGLLFFILAGTAVTLVTAAFRVGLQTLLPTYEPVSRRFVVTAVSVFLWFGVLVATFSLLGLEAVATSLGTTAGFLALGIGYSISHMLADVVSGVYLLRDEDFMPGDRVTLDGTPMTVVGTRLRKSRFRHDGNITVRRNAEVETQWTKLHDKDNIDGG